MTLPVFLCIASAAPVLSLQGTVDGRPVQGWVYARVGQQVTLQLRTSGKAKPENIRWFQLEPTVESVDNTQPKFHFEPIPYAEVEVKRCAGRTECAAEIEPTRLNAVPALKGAGTLAWQARATVGGVELATPGVESVKYGGLTASVMRVTFRADDSYLGYVSELLYTPYIFGSAGPDGRNQSDLLIGSDCADLAVYGRRRLGKKNTYTSSYEIDRQAPEIARLADEGSKVEFATAKKNSARPGDLLHFPGSRHVAILFQDREPLGSLGPEDLMLHTCWAPPKVEPIGQSSCASYPWRVLRFKDN